MDSSNRRSNELLVKMNCLSYYKKKKIIINSISMGNCNVLDKKEECEESSIF